MVMSTHLLDITSVGPASNYVQVKQQLLLAASLEELASLRFSVILTARWERSASEDLERREELRDELARLRRQYAEKIDEIAMTFGIQTAMNAKDEVESSVTVPKGIDLSLALIEDGDFDL
jgi:hypothetical protein